MRETWQGSVPASTRDLAHAQGRHEVYEDPHDARGFRTLERARGALRAPGVLARSLAFDVYRGLVDLEQHVAGQVDVARATFPDLLARSFSQVWSRDHARTRGGPPQGAQPSECAVHVLGIDSRLHLDHERCPATIGSHNLRNRTEGLSPETIPASAWALAAHSASPRLGLPLA